MLQTGQKKMSNFFHYAVLEVECICCGNGDARHVVVGVFASEDLAMKVKVDVDAHRRKVGLVFPHSETVIVPVQAVNLVIEPYKSMMRKK